MSSTPPTRPWQRSHHWAAMALQAGCPTAEGKPWTTRVLAVLDAQVADGTPQRVTRRVNALLSAMYEDPDVPRWDTGVEVVRAAHARGPAEGALTQLPVLAAGAPSTEPLPTLLLGFTARHPILGLIAVQRGYLSTVSVTGPGAPNTAAHVWQPGGPGFPSEALEAQAVLAAFAYDFADDVTAVMGSRVSTPAAPLSAEQEQVIVDLEPDGTPLGTLALLHYPPALLRAAAGRGLAVADTVELELFAPGWLVGRWWLHHVLTQLEQASTAAGPTSVDIDDPPRHLCASWAAVRADQRGPRALGELLTPAEARFLPDRLLADTTVERTPSQGWLWQQIGHLAESATGNATQLLEQLRSQWRQWPELAEPETFAGSAISLRR